MLRRASCVALLALFAGFALNGLSSASTDDTGLARSLQSSYDRTSSPVMVRVIAERTRAALDFAAHDRNRLFHYPLSGVLATPAEIPTLSGLDFGGALAPETIADRMEQTPLTADELARPMAWRPMVEYLAAWEYEKARPLMLLVSGVTAQKWGNERLVRPLQQVATAFLHGDEIWAKIEFRPELSWIPADDEDGDGYREVYGKVATTAYDSAVVTRLREDYLGVELTEAQVRDRFFKLSSEWYQALQTVTLQPEETRPWPNEKTEPGIRAAMAGVTFAEPFAVIRAEPYGEPLYNVFILGEPVIRSWEAELARFGGSWEAWNAVLADFRADVRAQLDARPAELRGLIGRDGFLFFRGDLELLLCGDLRKQPNGRDPFPAIVDFNEQLKARGIDMLLVVIPTKSEVYPEKLSERAPAGARPYVTPYVRKLMRELSEAGVAIVDLLPSFIAQRAEVDGELLYMSQDAHWTNRGVRLAAKLIADRVRRYPWYEQRSSANRVAYTLKNTPFTRMGDIVAMLTDQEQLAYRPMELTARQVVAPDGSLYEDSPNSPVTMLGDSFTGVFHFEDCGHAGLSAHLAHELGLPIDLIMAQGSGPRIRGSFARRGPEAIASKKLVIWTVVSRDLHNYWAPWEKIALP